jgi:hypothetical protein
MKIMKNEEQFAKSLTTFFPLRTSHKNGPRMLNTQPASLPQEKATVHFSVDSG